MRAVIDESVPRQLVPELTALGHDIGAFPNAWKGLKNGRLIERIRSDGIQVLVTCDKNFRHQQNIARAGIGLIVLPSPFMPYLLSNLPAVGEALVAVELGQVVELEFVRKTNT